MLPYDPFSSVRPDRWSIGLRPVGLDEWLVRDGDLDAQLAEKQRLLAVAHEACVASIGGEAVEEACTEAAELIGVAIGESTVHLGRGIASLEAVARLVAEDLVIMMPPTDDTDAGYVLGAAVLCFPTRWLLADKIGRPMRSIHGPVPGYESQIGRSTNRVFDALDSRVVTRANWSLLDSGELHQPSGSHTVADDPTLSRANAAERVWVRTERQTLRRLPRTCAVLFTIRVFQCRLDELQTTLHRPLLDALERVHNDMRTYKSLDILDQAVRGWLRDRRSDAAASGGVNARQQATTERQAESAGNGRTDHGADRRGGEPDPDIGIVGERPEQRRRVGPDGDA